MCNLIGSLNEITEKITGCAIEVHRNSGLGQLESIYENALCFELNRIGIKSIDRYDPVLKNGIKRIIL
jgi:GxxExxY protein